MPQIDENQASPAADTFTRRFAAAALDVMFVAMPAMLLAATSAERFSIIEETGGRARFSVPDQLRINEIDQGLNRAMQVGDTVLTLSGAGLWLTLITLAMLTVLVFFVVPGLQRGQTPGRSLMRLPIQADDEAGVELLSVSVTETASEPTERTDSQPAPQPSSEITSIDKAATEVRDQNTDRDTDQDIDLDLQSAPVPEAQLAESALEAEPNREPESAPAPAEDQNRELRDLLQSGIEQGMPAAQVTLGDDAEYDRWTDLDDLDLVDRHDGGQSQDNPFETLTLPESSLSETPLTASTGRNGASTDRQCATATVERGTETGTEAEQEPSTAVTPEWSEELQSWVYRDEATDRWFRHDQDANRWVQTDR